MQSTGEAPTTPKHTKDNRESFFPVTATTLHPTPVNPDTATPENLLRLNDLHSKSKPASSSSSSSSTASSVPPSQESHRDTEHLRSQNAETPPSTSDLAHGKFQGDRIFWCSVMGLPRPHGASVPQFWFCPFFWSLDHAQKATGIFVLVLNWAHLHNTYFNYKDWLKEWPLPHTCICNGGCILGCEITE